MIPPLGEVLVKTVRRFLPDFSPSIERLPEPRDPDLLYYPKQTLIWSVLLIFVLGLRSRRQFRFESASVSFVANLNRLSACAVETAPHDDTIVYYLERVDPQNFQQWPAVIDPALFGPNVPAFQIRLDSS